jgi:hypothetical protein
MSSNKHLHSVIKLRHLKNASQNNWEMLSNTRKMVGTIISEAHQLMNKFGKTTAKEQFATDGKCLATNISDIQQSLNDFKQFIQDPKSIDPEIAFQKFNNTLERTNELFDSISSYPDIYFKDMDITEWSDTWKVIKSNMTIVQGLGESAYIKSLMIKNFNDEEVDKLTKEIVRYIPQTFNLLEADKYKQEYLQAVKEIEQESNAKENLWDRFLNVLAGAIPFKQTPEERVMMRRWLDGEKGEL